MAEVPIDWDDEFRSKYLTEYYNLRPEIHASLRALMDSRVVTTYGVLLSPQRMLEIGSATWLTEEEKGSVVAKIGVEEKFITWTTHSGKAVLERMK